MSTNFPASLDTLTNPIAGDFLNSPDHAGQHTNANDAIEALEAKVGANSSAVTTSHDYKLSNVTGVNKAVSSDRSISVGTGLTGGGDLSADRTISLSTPVSIANGGTGAASVTDAFDALAPTTTKGDLIVHTGADNVRQAVGTNGYYLIADSTQTNGIRWGDIGSASYTASGAIAQFDIVYPSAAGTVKTLYPSAQGTGTAVTTSPSHFNSNTKVLPMSGGRYLHVTGGSSDENVAIYCQIRTVNAGETDFSNGSEATIQATAGSYHFDVAEISTDKFLLIYQKFTGASTAAGILVRVISVSGTTITLGSELTIETTGNTSSTNAICKLDTDKALIMYRQDASGNVYTQVITVSGTTASSNSAVLTYTASGACKATSLAQLGVNSAVGTVTDSGSANLYAYTFSISGTTITVNAQNTLTSTGVGYTAALKPVSSTKALLCYSESSTPVNDSVANLSISGATVTKSSNLSMTSSFNDNAYFGMYVISTKYALVSSYSSTTNIKAHLIDISASAPTLIQTQDLTSGDTSGLYASTAIVRILPWTFMITGSLGNSDYIVKLTPVSSNRIGVASAAIVDAATGTILERYNSYSIFSGLTVGTYYVNDDGQPTTISSLTAPTLGIAVSATKMLLQ